MWVKRSVSTALLIALSATITLMSAGAASAITNDESQFVSLINKERSSRGKRTLSVKSDLVDVARRQSARMAKEGRIWHNPNLSSQVDGWTTLGENVGMGPSVTSLHKAFMNSPGHRENILLGDYNQIGIGIVVADDTIYVTEVFAERRTAKTVSRSTSSTASKATGGATAVLGRVASQSPTTTPVAAPKPKPIKAKARTVDLLLRVVGYDAETVDPATGLAAGA